MLHNWCRSKPCYITVIIQSPRGDETRGRRILTKDLCRGICFLLTQVRLFASQRKCVSKWRGGGKKEKKGGRFLQMCNIHYIHVCEIEVQHLWPIFDHVG